MEYNRDAMTCACEARPESVSSLIAKSEDIARSIENTVRALESSLFGCGENEAKQDEPRCFRDVCAQHMERMVRIDAMLNSIKERLGM